MSTDTSIRDVLVRGATPSQRTRGRSFPLVRTSFAAVTIAMLTLAGSAVGAADPQASCNGIAVSSAAGQPGLVADLTRLIHDELKAEGVAPGTGDAAFAKLHAGSVDACFGE